MKRILFHKNWKIDLSNTLLSKVMSNSYFTDNFFAMLTYPFDILTEEKNAQFIHHQNQNNFQKIYEKLIFQEDGNIEECKLIILESEGKRKSAQLVIGFDNFPNFNKKLSELPLHKFALQGETIYEHAKLKIKKTYPDTDYNFPAVHTDLINKDNYILSSFQGTYNLYREGEFVRNVIESDGQIKNYNLMEPVVYYLYLLKTAFADAGYDLKGDILEDEILQKACIFKGNTYSNEKYPSPVEWIVDKRSAENNHPIFRDRQEISFNGTFRIKGIAYILGWGNIFRIKDISTGKVVWESQSKKNTETIDIIVNTTKDTVLEFEGYDPGAGFTGNKILELTITPVTIYKEDGSIYNPNINNSEIDLTKCVPDITVGELVKASKNTYNLDLDVANKIVYMNKIESEIINYSNLLDFRKFEVVNPKIKFNEDLSFLLRFQFESEDYPFQSLYVDKSGSKTENFQKLENTQEIISPVIPLPSIVRNNLNSAKALSESDRDIQIILYSGLKNGKNETETNKDLLWPELYKRYWKKWLNFRINSDTFIWKFNAKKSDLRDLKVKSKIHAYNRIHIIKKITRNDLSDSTDEVEIETSSE